MPEPGQDSPVPVLHIITRLIVGGAQENTLYTAAMLDPARFQVDVVSGPQTGSEGSLIEEALQKQIRLMIVPDLVRQIAPLRDLRALFDIIELLRRKKYSIVHTHSSKAGIIGRLAARIAGVPVIVHTVHGWSFHDYMSPPVRWMYILLERWMARLTDAFIVVAEHDRKKGGLARIGSDSQYHLIRSAIPLDEFNPQHAWREAARQELHIPQDAVVIGNVGRFSPQKNPLAWVKVAGMVGRQNPAIWFLLVGDGPLRSQVQAQIQQEGIAGRTVLAGLRRDIPQMMAAMDIFLLTSLWEGLPRVIPQAMAMGLPVITNRADGTSEAIADGLTGQLFDPGDLQRMAEACSQLAQDAPTRQAMGTRGRRHASQEFDLQTMIQHISDLYEMLLQAA